MIVDETSEHDIRYDCRFFPTSSLHSEHSLASEDAAAKSCHHIIVVDFELQ